MKVNKQLAGVSQVGLFVCGDSVVVGEAEVRWLICWNVDYFKKYENELFIFVHDNIFTIS